MNLQLVLPTGCVVQPYDMTNADLVAPANTTWQIAAGVKNPIQVLNITQALSAVDIKLL